AYARSCVLHAAQLSRPIPTRRSSDLVRGPGGSEPAVRASPAVGRMIPEPRFLCQASKSAKTSRSSLPCVASSAPAKRPACSPRRSEEHTSELQSRENLVCRLLLEKKN